MPKAELPSNTGNTAQHWHDSYCPLLLVM